MKKLLVPAILVIGLLLTGCPGGGPADYHPLKVGDKAEMDIITTSVTTVFVPDTTVTTKGPDTISTVSEVIGTDKLTSGEDVFVVKSTTADTIIDTSFMRKDSDSLYVYDAKTDSVASYVEPLELKVGTKWTQKPDTTITITYEVKADTAKITVPAGTYSNCLVISITTTPSTFPVTQYQYRAKDVGAVKSTMHSEFETPGIMKVVNDNITELTKYTH
jgi:hypothetical protein